MEKQKYIMAYEDFQADHPEIDVEWREFIEPVVMGADDAILGFILGYILV